MATMLKVSKMPIKFWQEQGDDDDVEVWGATADSGSNGFIRGGGEATEGNSWWTHGSEQVATLHKSTINKYTSAQIHFNKIYKSTGAIHVCTVHPTKFDQYKVQVLHKSKRWTQETQKAWGADRDANSFDCSLCEDSQTQARCQKIKCSVRT